MQCKSVRSASRKSQSKSKSESQSKLQSDLQPHTIFQLFSNCQDRDQDQDRDRDDELVLEEKSSLIALHTKWINVIEEEDVAIWHCRGRFSGSRRRFFRTARLFLSSDRLFSFSSCRPVTNLNCSAPDSRRASFSLSKGLRLHCWQLSNAAHQAKPNCRLRVSLRIQRQMSARLHRKKKFLGGISLR